jgi:hypothetical protein
MINLVALGQVGSTIVSAGDTKEGNYCGFICLADTVLTNLRGSVDGTDYTAVTFPAGLYIPIPFNSVTINTGRILAIKNSSY